MVLLVVVFCVGYHGAICHGLQSVLHGLLI
jgi:hypothetical protein